VLVDEVGDVAVVVTVDVNAEDVVCVEELPAFAPLWPLLVVPLDEPQPASASVARAHITVARVCIGSFSAILSSNPS
jgi:hypothetical protein